MAVFRSSVFFPLLLLRLLSARSTATPASSWKVKYLPGFSGPLPFELETGYVGVGDSEEVQLFYYFVKSQRNPQIDPLLTFFTGGPGCSSLSSFINGVGPINFKIEPYNGSVPRLVFNPHTWTKKANLLFTEAPVGTGFSYSTTLQSSKKGDMIQVEQIHQFLRKWLAKHEEFISNPFYVGGESYSGIIIPLLSQAISEGNNQAFPKINLKGYIEGNPVTVRNSIEKYKIHYSHRLSLISDELYLLLTTSCNGEYENVQPTNLECIKHLSTYEKCVSRINIACILCRQCEDVANEQEDATSLRRSLYNTSVKVLPSLSLDCQEYVSSLRYYWANDDQVRKALHVRKVVFVFPRGGTVDEDLSFGDMLPSRSQGTIGEWFRCRSTKDYQYEIMNVVPYHANLSSKGYRSLIFSGDHDLEIPLLDTEAWIKSLNYSIVDDWRPYFDTDEQILGYTRTYANSMTFATIKGGGHTSQVKQYPTAIMFYRWIDGNSL